MFQHNRRDFLKRTVAGSAFATFVISGTKTSGRVLGANDRVRIAVAGINGQGRWRLNSMDRRLQPSERWLSHQALRTLSLEMSKWELISVA